MEHKKWSHLVAQGGIWHHTAMIRFTPDRVSRQHDHDFAEIFWVEQGVARHFINGESRALNSGDLIFVRPEDCHSLRAIDDAGFTLWNLAYPDEVRRECAARLPEEAVPWLQPATRMPARVRLPATTLSTFRRRIERMSQAPDSRVALEYFITGLLESVRLAAVAEVPAMPDWLQRACEAAKKPEVFAQGAAGLVRVAGRSHEHVARSLRTVLGCTPSEHINRIRMEYAARELRVTSRPITQIALDCGINNLSHFYGLFRRAHGNSPRAYRLKFQKTVV
jgi:AraC family transcriptional regulator, dual regulator of chb operon